MDDGQECCDRNEQPDGLAEEKVVCQALNEQKAPPGQQGSHRQQNGVAVGKAVVQKEVGGGEGERPDGEGWQQPGDWGLGIGDGEGEGADEEECGGDEEQVAFSACGTSVILHRDSLLTEV